MTPAERRLLLRVAYELTSRSPMHTEVDLTTFREIRDLMDEVKHEQQSKQADVGTEVKTSVGIETLVSRGPKKPDSGST